jgi:ribonucleoside-diphosphate reductase subunit M2
MYKKAEAYFWTAEEFDLAADATDWDRLSTTEQHFILHVLAFFTASDGIVNKNLSSNFATKVTSLEARCFYGFQIAFENIHSKRYLLSHRHVRQGPHEEDAPASDRDRPLCPAESTVGAQMVQLHCSQLCRTHDRVCRSRRHIIFGLLLCNLLVEKAPGLCFSNELISRDEGLHCNFACLLYSKLINKLPESCINEIISSAVKIEMEFVVNALPVELIGMNLGMMCNYIRFCADRLFPSASDVAATTKSETLSSGWRRSVYRAKLTSSRSELGNTPSGVGA